MGMGPFLRHNRSMRRVFALTALVSLVLAGGCARQNVVYSDPSGNKVTVSGDHAKTEVTDDKGNKATYETGPNGGGTVTVHDDKGESKMESGKGVSEADLGLPFYPGSTDKPEASMKVETPDGKNVLSVRSTTDEPSKVIDFYKPKLKETTVNTMGDSTSETQVLLGKTDGDLKVMVTAVHNKDSKETQINVTVTLEKKKD